MSQFDLPTQFEIKSLEIEGQDCSALMQSLSVFENIYSPIISGQLTLMETDEVKFIEKNKIEGSEEFKFQIKNAKGDEYKFEGFLNGLRNKDNSYSITVYTFDFTTKELRKNEEKFISRAFKEKEPKEIVEKMIKEMDGKTDKIEGKGKKMTYVVPRRRPWEVIKYVLRHGAVQDANASEGDTKKQEEETKGVGGFLCWNTHKGFRFATIKDVIDGKAGEDAGEFELVTQNKGASTDELMKTIVNYDFQVMGDIHAKMRSGAFKSNCITFDLDKLQYKEHEYDNQEMMTDKQKKAVEEITRTMVCSFSNERHENKPDKTQNSRYDQRKLTVQQTAGGENTFNDIQGTMSLYPQLKFRPGDTLTAKIYKTPGEKGGGMDRKHSGKYVIQEVAHHFNVAGNKGYTRVTLIRSTKQQQDGQ
jgi:hypothetical protein